MEAIAAEAPLVYADHLSSELENKEYKQWHGVVAGGNGSACAWLEAS